MTTVVHGSRLPVLAPPPPHPYQAAAKSFADRLERGHSHQARVLWPLKALPRGGATIKSNHRSEPARIYRSPRRLPPRRKSIGIVRRAKGKSCDSARAASAFVSAPVMKRPIRGLLCGAQNLRLRFALFPGARQPRKWKALNCPSRVYCPPPLTLAINVTRRPSARPAGLHPPVI